MSSLTPGERRLRETFNRLGREWRLIMYAEPEPGHLTFDQDRQVENLTSGGPQIVEINARIAGDCIAELVHLASGVDLYDVAADLALRRGLSVEEAGPASFPFSAAIRFLSAPPGRVLAVEGVDEVAAGMDPRHDRLAVFPRVGDIVGRLASNLERAGYVLARARTAAEAVALAEDRASHIRILTEPAP
jgi:biotin carboxylase